MGGPIRDGEMELAVVERRNNPWVVGATAIGTLAYLAYALLARGPSVGITVYTCALAWWGVLRGRPKPRRVATTARASRAGLALGDAPFVPAATLRDGVVVPREGQPTMVRLRRRRALAIELDVPDVDAGRALLGALGLGADQAAVSFRVGAPMTSHPALSVAVLVALFTLMPLAIFLGPELLGLRDPSAGLWIASVVAPLFVLAVGLLNWPARLTIGADGFVVGRFGRERVVRFDEVTRYESRETRWLGTYHLDIHLRSGPPVTISMASSSPETAAVIERIRQAVQTAGGAGSREDAAAALDRRARPMREWVGALRAIGAGANATHRRAPLAEDALAATVEDARSPATIRAAAAIALANGGDAARARIQGVARSVAAPKLRVALEAAANAADDEALAEALASLEAAEAEATTRR